LTTSAEFRKGIVKYLSADPRFSGKVPGTTRRLYSMWARKEYGNYMRMYEAGVSVPRPLAVYENVLVMDFIGSEGTPAPLLKDSELDLEKLREIFDGIIDDLKKMVLKARLVHGDLSEYNVMIWEGRHYIIDVSQAVTLDHPNAVEYLYRDLNNIVRFFGRKGLEVPTPQKLAESLGIL